MEDRIIIVREKAEIERLRTEGHEHLAIRNGVEYVFRLKPEEKKSESEFLAPRRAKKKEEIDHG